MSRRPRNIISRNRGLKLRAADLLDDGLTDQKVADILVKEFGLAVKRKAVLAFRNGTYKEVQEERNERTEAAEKVRLIIDAAGDSGSIHAKAGTDLIAKMLYDLLKKGGDVNAVAIGKTLVKIREVENENFKLQMQREKEVAANAIKEAAKNKELSSDELNDKVDEIMGLKKR